MHALGDPETRLTLSVIDAREAHGVWIAVLTREHAGAGSGSDALSGPPVLTSRPRQATMHKNMTAMITSIDTNVTRMLGWPADQLVGSRSSEFLHPDDQERAVSVWMPAALDDDHAASADPPPVRRRQLAVGRAREHEVVRSLVEV